MTKSRAERTVALDAWAEAVEADDLKPAETSALRSIAALAEQRSALDDDLAAAVRDARQSGRSWSEIGAMLGVSKQAAQRKYGPISATS